MRGVFFNMHKSPLELGRIKGRLAFCAHARGILVYMHDIYIILIKYILK